LDEGERGLKENTSKRHTDREELRVQASEQVELQKSQWLEKPGYSVRTKDRF
jgi:hypothetical protein